MCFNRAEPEEPLEVTEEGGDVTKPLFMNANTVMVFKVNWTSDW